ncbi:MAG: CapA family protein [Acidobacteria bacterium]|nr:CapA family protein [Acidobacteriota bacterium]
MPHHFAMGATVPILILALGAFPAATPILAAAEPQRSLVLLAGGDVTLGYHLPEFQDELMARGMSATESAAYPFARIAAITRAADLFLVNLEGTLTTQGQPVEKSFNFKAEPQDVAILQTAGVDVVSLANNHALDYSAEGLRQTRATLLRAGIAAFGAGRDLAEARRPAILERNGVRVGFLGYLFMGDHTIEPEVIYAGPGRAGAAGTHKDLPTLLHWIREDVTALRPRVDLLVVVFHGGRESSNLIEPYQRQVAETAVAAGADLLVGHHPHTLQGLEQIAGATVAYSLGNLMFAGNWNPRRKEAALLELTWKEASRTRVRILPLAVDNLPAEPFQPRFLPEDQAARVHALMNCYITALEEGACEAALDPPVITGDDNSMAETPKTP